MRQIFSDVRDRRLSLHWMSDALSVRIASHPLQSTGAKMCRFLCNQRSRRESNESMQMVESPNVETECLPFSSIPHTTRLFDDYLHHFDRVERFYARPPLSPDWWADEIKKINYPTERRQTVAAILERQNREFRGRGKNAGKHRTAAAGRCGCCYRTAGRSFRRADVLHFESLDGSPDGGEGRRGSNVLAGNRRP